MKKEKVKKIINNIDVMLLIVILITSTLSIRNIQLYEKIQIAVNFIMIGYFIIRMVRKNPIKLIQSKLDLFVVLLIISTVIPLISNTFISLYATVLTVLNYITLLWIYILTRETINRKRKNGKYITNVIIFTTVLLILVGIENLAGNKIFEILGINYIINGESRLVSLFGNPNAFAALIAFSFFLSIHKTVSTTNLVERNIFSLVNTILILGLVLTYSKAMFVIFPIMLLIYMVGLKERHKNVYIIQNVGLSLILSVMYIFTFEQIQKQECYWLLLWYSLIFFILASLLHLFNIKMTKYLEKIKTSTVIIGMMMISIVICIGLKAELHKTKELEVFTVNNSTDYQAKKIKNVQPNKKYIFSFDMITHINLAMDENIEEVFSINIIQRDKKNKEITNKEVKFGNFSGQKEIEIETTPNTVEIKIEFKCKYKYTAKYWIIHSLKINKEEITLAYQHLPTKLVEKIQDIDVQYKTAQERFEFIKDGFKIIFQNFLTGIGGNGWQYKYQEVQEYEYIANDTHSYFIQVWIENGILGIIGLVGIVYFIIKKKDEKYRGIQIALLCLLAHSMIDSDMYFNYIKIVMFSTLAILPVHQLQKGTKKDNYWNVGLIIVAAFSIVVLFTPKIYHKALIKEELEQAKVGLYLNSEKYRQINRNLVNACNNIIKYERDFSTVNQNELEKLQAYMESGEEGIEERVEEFYTKMLNHSNKYTYNTKKMVEKSNYICKAIRLLNLQQNPKWYPLIAKLAKLNIEEFDETKEQMKNAIQQKYKVLEEDIDYNSLLYNYQYSVSMYKQYVLGIAIYNKSDIDITKYIQDNEVRIDNKEDILLYHTHTTEGYYSKDSNYVEIEYGKTLNPDYNVLSVGAQLKEDLQNQNLNVIHIQDYHDKQGVNGAYDRSLQNVENKMKEQDKKIDIVFDIHRDAYIENFNSKNYIEKDGEKFAKLRFVIAVGHEGWQNNLKWAVKLQKKADEQYPGLFEPMYIYNKTYNQSISKYATLIEVGNNANTIQEAKKSIQCFAQIVKECIDEI